MLIIQFKNHSFNLYFSVFGNLCYLRNPCGLRSDPIEMDVKKYSKNPQNPYIDAAFN